MQVDPVKIKRNASRRLRKVMAKSLEFHRHCERSEAIHGPGKRKNGLLRCARNDGLFCRLLESDRHANSKISASTASVAPGAAWIFLPVPPPPPRSTFCTFIPSTTPTV